MSAPPLIDEQTAQNLRAFFGERLQQPVDITLYTEDDENGEAVDFTRRFLTELAALNERIDLREMGLDESGRAEGLVSPSVVLGAELGYRIAVHGAPSGHEAGALVETIGLVGSGDSGLGAGSRELLGAIDKDVLLYSFVTPT